jgi:hypothetical protein
VYPALSYAVAAFLGVVAVVSLVAIRVPSLDLVARTAMRVGQVAAVVVVVLDLITLLQGHEVGSDLTHVGYAVATLGLPAILLKRRPEEDGEPGEPPHLAVLAVTAVALTVLVVRLQQTW